MIIETNSSFYRTCRESEQHYVPLGRLGQTFAFEGGWYLWWIGL